MEGFMWRHQPRTQNVLALLRKGSIGELRQIRCSFSFDIGRGDWRLDPARGGGALWDVGCYGINTCRLFSESEPQEIQAAARWWATGVDMTLTSTLMFPSGVLGQVDCSFEVPFRCQYELIGTGGVIEVPRAYLPDDRPEILLRKGDELTRLQAPHGDQYAAMVDHFSRAVATAHPELPLPAETGLANMQVLDAVLAAARNSSKHGTRPLGGRAG
jgi:predicted dehydrogenase